jgi:hypothetical protein
MKDEYYSLILVQILQVLLREILFLDSRELIVSLDLWKTYRNENKQTTTVSQNNRYNKMPECDEGWQQ